MKIIKIISTWKKNPRDSKQRIPKGKKRVQAIVNNGRGPETQHIDVDA